MSGVKLLFMLSLIIVLLCPILMPAYGASITGKASWYSEKEIAKINPSMLMANGKRFREEAMTCAIWEIPFGTWLKVTNMVNKKSVVVRVTDRGPARRLKRAIDLSKSAFMKIGRLEDGLIEVEIEEVENE